MMPARDHTGTPRHFHSSTTSGTACLISARTRASVSPRQSPSSSILTSINREGASSSFPSLATFVVFFMGVSLCFMLPVTRRSLGAAFGPIASRLVLLNYARDHFHPGRRRFAAPVPRRLGIGPESADRGREDRWLAVALRWQDPRPLARISPRKRAG